MRHPGVCTRLTASGLTSLLQSVAALRVQEIEHGLWRWTAPHPDWLPASGETGGWVEEVGSVYAELPGAILLIDPVVPADAEDAARLWRALDRDVERLRRPVCVLVTVHWHRRASDEVLQRYGAFEGVVPDGATAIPLGDPIGETVYALPGYGALVPGDIVLGGDGIEGERVDGLRVCPPGWYGRTAAERWWYGGVGPAERPRPPRAGRPRARARHARRAAPERRRPGPARARRGRQGPAGRMSATIAAERVAGQDELLDAMALQLIGDLERRFGPRRRALLQAREEREQRFAAGERPSFPEETRELREADWSVAGTPPDLNDRRVEITGPAEAKMVINALNSGASVFMCCLEDALSPTWANVVAGQQAVRDADRRTLEFRSPEGKHYALGEQLATLVVRPRGWHLDERHVHVDGRPVSASLFDLALYLRWNGRASVERGSGPYVYLAKLESRHEAELWNDVFVAAQEAVGLPRGTIRATVLIETITASFEMEEILFALREHSAGLNAGRWDYIFSAIKKFRDDPALVLPDRAAVTMAVPFMHAYTEQLVRACHRRGAHAIGGMAAFIPSRDAAINEQAFASVREDKEREAGQGFDGTWVAHPGLVPLAREIFDAALGDRPNQKDAPARGRAFRTRARCSRWTGRRARSRSRACRRTSPSACATSTPGSAASAPLPSTTSWRTRRRPRSRAHSCGSGSATAAARARARSSRPSCTPASATPCWRACRATRHPHADDARARARRPRAGHGLRASS